MNSRVVTVAVALIVGGGVGFAAGKLTQADGGNTAFEKRARDYCDAVHSAIDLDARDLAKSEDPKRQRAAADRFMTLATYHSESEILMCSASPPDMSAWQACWLKYDYPCLEKVARTAAASTKTH